MVAAIPLSVQMGEAKAAAPKRGGKLRQGVRGGATSDRLEGAQLIDTHNINTSWQIRNNLTEVTADGDVTGELAESWEPNKDASIWVFKLRDGVEFHNGKTLEANDVVYSINAHRGPDSKSVRLALSLVLKSLRPMEETLSSPSKRATPIFRS